MVLLGEEAQVEALFYVFGDSANLRQDSCTVCMERTVCSEFNLDAPYSNKTFWTQSMVLLGEEAQVEARFGLFGDSANLMQDSCTVCMECIRCLEINLDALDGTPR